jgi:indole-3-glycerol phosphate synthase
VGTEALLDSRRRWNLANRKVEGVFKATAVALPLPPSFNDGVRVARADRAVVVGLKRKEGLNGSRSYDFDFVEMAQRAEAAGACALAIWPEEEFFGGSYQDILAVAQVTSLPILSRDPVLDPLQIVMARAHGAAAITIQVGFVGEEELRALVRHAIELGLDVLMEGGTAAELERIAKFKMGTSDSSGARLVAVGGPLNPPDGMRTYERLSPLIPEFAASLATSGIEDPNALGALETAGYEAFLVSDALLAASDFEAAMADYAGLPFG